MSQNSNNAHSDVTIRGGHTACAAGSAAQGPSLAGGPPIKLSMHLQDAQTADCNGEAESRTLHHSSSHHPACRRGPPYYLTSVSGRTASAALRSRSRARAAHPPPPHTAQSCCVVGRVSQVCAEPLHCVVAPPPCGKVSSPAS